MEQFVQLSRSNENGHHFLKLLRSENEKLQRLVSLAECALERSGDLSDENSGKLRIVVGKAKLLMHKRFHQFEELCKRNLDVNSKGRLTVTSEDLAGYWDIVKMQISQICDIFEEVASE